MELSASLAYYGTMLSHPPRALLALAAFLALQGSPAARTTACTLTGHHVAGSDGESSRGAAAIAMGDMPGMSSKLVRSASARPTMDVDPATDQIKAPGRSGGAPCEHETAPPGCTVMPLCVVFVKSSTVRLDRTAVPVARAATMASRAPASVAFPPEIPPPRA